MLNKLGSANLLRSYLFADPPQWPAIFALITLTLIYPGNTEYYNIVECFK